MSEQVTTLQEWSYEDSRLFYMGQYVAVLEAVDADETAFGEAIARALRASGDLADCEVFDDEVDQVAEAVTGLREVLR